MRDIYIYGFEDKFGNEFRRRCKNYEKAMGYAHLHELKVKRNTYVWKAGEEIADFTRGGKEWKK